MPTSAAEWSKWLSVPAHDPASGFDFHAQSHRRADGVWFPPGLDPITRRWIDRAYENAWGQGFIWDCEAQTWRSLPGFESQIESTQAQEAPASAQEPEPEPALPLPSSPSQAELPVIEPESEQLPFTAVPAVEMTGPESEPPPAAPQPEEELAEGPACEPGSLEREDSLADDLLSAADPVLPEAITDPGSGGSIADAEGPTGFPSERVGAAPVMDPTLSAIALETPESDLLEEVAPANEETPPEALPFAPAPPESDSADWAGEGAPLTAPEQADGSDGLAIDWPAETESPGEEQVVADQYEQPPASQEEVIALPAGPEPLSRVDTAFPIELDESIAQAFAAASEEAPVADSGQQQLGEASGLEEAPSALPPDEGGLPDSAVVEALPADGREEPILLADDAIEPVEEVEDLEAAGQPGDWSGDTADTAMDATESEPPAGLDSAIAAGEAPELGLEADPGGIDAEGQGSGEFDSAPEVGEAGEPPASASDGVLGVAAAEAESVPLPEALDDAGSPELELCFEASTASETAALETSPAPSDPSLGVVAEGSVPAPSEEMVLLPEPVAAPAQPALEAPSASGPSPTMPEPTWDWAVAVLPEKPLPAPGAKRAEASQPTPEQPRSAWTAGSEPVPAFADHAARDGAPSPAAPRISAPVADPLPSWIPVPAPTPAPSPVRGRASHDTLVPVPLPAATEPASPTPRPAAPRMPTPRPAATVQGEHRVAAHLLDGQVRRGTIRDANLIGSSIALETMPGNLIVELQVPKLKALFFVNPPGARPPPEPAGTKVRVTFVDDRQVVGISPDYEPNAPGFFLVPMETRTNIARVFVYAQAVRNVEKV